MAKPDRTFPIIIILAILMILLAHSLHAEDAQKNIIVDESQSIKMSADSTVKAVSPDELQRIVNNYKKLFEEKDARISALESRIVALENQINQ